MGPLVSHPAAFVFVTHILVSDNSNPARMNLLSELQLQLDK